MLPLLRSLFDLLGIITDLEFLDTLRIGMYSETFHSLHQKCSSPRLWKWLFGGSGVVQATGIWSAST